jgi:hypothetical protein
MRVTLRLLIAAGLLFAGEASGAAEPVRVYVSGGYQWAPGYYAGGVYVPAPGYYYFAPGYYTAAPTLSYGWPPGAGYAGSSTFSRFPNFRTPMQTRPSPSGVMVPGHTPGSYATQRVHGINPNFYHQYLHPRAADLGGP